MTPLLGYEPGKQILVDVIDPGATDCIHQLSRSNTFTTPAAEPGE